MVSINYASREVCCKIVYYGPGLSGKTTNLQYVHQKVPSNTRGNMISLATEADRTLYFDFLPINIGTINGFAAKFQLYTVPGQVYYNATRKLVLRGVDGIVFVADSQPDKMDENIESLTNLGENLREYGYSFDDLSLVIQYNKRDLPGILSIEELNRQLNPRGVPHLGASASLGTGVFDTLKLIIKLVLDKAKGTASSQPAPPAVTSNNVAASVTSGGGSAQSSSTSTAVATAPETSAQYRPYPGSRSAAESPPIPAAAATQQEPPATQAEDTSDRTESSRTPGENSTESASPLMAPSVRRRNAPRKRGFFKRLFGIK